MEFSESALQQVREDRLLIDEVDRWLFEEISPYLGQRVLEIGCGLGNFARHLTDRQLYVGTETSAESVSHVAKMYDTYPNMRTAVVDATSAEFMSFTSDRIDTVFSLNVFEHIENHVTAMENVARVLQPGGRFVLVVPSHAWLYGSIDVAIGHYRRYDKVQMSALLREVGLEPTQLKYLNAPGAFGWFVNGRIRRQSTPPAGQLRLFNRLVPVIKRMEHLLPPPFGISLVSVAQKL